MRADAAVDSQLQSIYLRCADGSQRPRSQSRRQTLLIIQLTPLRRLRSAARARIIDVRAPLRPILTRHGGAR